MDAQEIRMRCLEVAQLATRTVQPSPASAIVNWAKEFEAFVVGDGAKPTKAKTEKAAP